MSEGVHHGYQQVHGEHIDVVVACFRGQLQLPAFDDLFDADVGEGCNHKAPEKVPEGDGLVDEEEHVEDDKESKDGIDNIVEYLYFAPDGLFVFLG